MQVGQMKLLTVFKQYCLAIHQKKKQKISNNNLIDSLKQSFKYWSGIDEDSRINCLLIWKEILKDKSDFLKNQTVLINNIQQDTENQVQQFLESWSNAIEESDFEAAKNSMQKWQDLFENLTNENVKIYSKVLETLETYWEDIQSKNIDQMCKI